MYNPSRLLPFSQIVFKRGKKVVARCLRTKFSEGKNEGGGVCAEQQLLTSAHGIFRTQKRFSGILRAVFRQVKKVEVKSFYGSRGHGFY